MKGERAFRAYFDRVDAPAAMRSFVLTELGSPARRWHGLVHHLLMLPRSSAPHERPASVAI